MRIRSRRTPLFASLVLALGIALVASACSENSNEPAPQATANAAQIQWKKFADIADKPEIKLDWRTRPDPPSGFTSKDMDTFAKSEVALIEKAISADVGHMKPDDAVDYVLADLPTGTRADYQSTIPSNPAGKRGWEWYLASLYKRDVAASSKIIRVDWATDTTAGALDDGTPSRYLNLSLQVFIAHDFGPVDHPRNVLVRRTVRLSGYKPNGGPDWWPSLTTTTSPFGNNGCALNEDSTLVPLEGAKYLKKDIAGLQKAWKVEGVAPLGKVTKPDPETAKKYEAICAANNNVL